YFVCVSVRLFAIKLTGPLVPYTPLFRSGLAARASWPSFPCRKSSQKWPTRPSRPRSTRNGSSLRHHVAVTRELAAWLHPALTPRSEEHTSELQSREKLECRLLLE